jgi:ATP-dependent DNA helicase RecG
VPVYPLTTGLTQWQLRRFVTAGLALAGDVPDHFPEPFRTAHRLVSLAAALRGIHQPTSDADVAAARRRLAFDEVFFLQLSRTLSRQRRRERTAPRLTASLDALIRCLPVSLTVDQARAAEDVLQDLAQPYPMARLLQGEVGSGKTMVAALAAAAAASNGYQVLYLAPTDVLASQQYEALRQLLEPFEASVALLTRTDAAAPGAAGRRTVLAVIREGAVAVAVGTHALLQPSVRFKSLGLVVVDEQHRFGVEQRLAAQVKAEGLTPHLLSMTATPIPRTLQLAFLGDLDISTLRTLPHGERTVKTFLFGPADRRRVEAGIRRRIARGEQVFVVCPLIDPSDKLGVKSATAEYERLRGEAFPDVPIGLLHGKLKAGERAAVLGDFRERRLAMLVATTVVEVGLDVPEATVMVVEGAERFGLAQLHQLRGRVGRRGGDGVCVLFTEQASALARKRLELFAKTSDAFRLAELDLKLRGPGEWFGTEQSGFVELRVASLDDTPLLEETRQAATELLASDQGLRRHQAIGRKVAELLDREHHVS